MNILKFLTFTSKYFINHRIIPDTSKIRNLITICIVALSLVFWNVSASADSRAEAEATLTKLQAELAEKKAELKEVERQERETELKAKQFAQQHFPQEAGNYVTGNLKLLVYYSLKGLTFAAMIADPLLGLKSLFTGWMLDYMVLSDQELQIIDTTKAELDEQKKELAEQEVKAADLRLKLHESQKCLTDNKTAVNDYLSGFRQKTEEEISGQKATDSELECNPAEIFPSESSICRVRITQANGETKFISVPIQWIYSPDYKPFSRNGIIRGEEVVQGLKYLPQLITVSATFTSNTEDGEREETREAEVQFKSAEEEQPTSEQQLLLSLKADKNQVRAGESITYFYDVRSSGTHSYMQVQLQDDQCSPVLFETQSDTNQNGQLDQGEAWTYSCQMKLVNSTTSTAKVTAIDSLGQSIQSSEHITIPISPDQEAANSCTSPQIRVPNLVPFTELEARQALSNLQLVGQVSGKVESEEFSEGQVVTHSPQEGSCVPPYSLIDLVLATKRDPNSDSDTDTSISGSLSAELECGSGFELSPGDFTGKSCGITVKGWNQGTEDRVIVEVQFNEESGIEVFPGNTSAPPSLMYTAGTTDYYDRYIFSQSFRAKTNASPGITTFTFIVSQANSGRVVLPLTIAVLEKGLLPSSDIGIRPPAEVAGGSGGNSCVWRYKMFGDPPPCFHFVTAQCDSPRYSAANGYELVGINMTLGEADNRMRQLSRYFQDEYNCHPWPTRTDKKDLHEDSDGDGVANEEDGCPDDASKITPGKCGCGHLEEDSDSDGVCDHQDSCPNDNPDDTDGDGVCDSLDKCPEDNPDDTDGDGLCNSNDPCPYDDPGDSDGDGVCDSDDQCPGVDDSFDSDGDSVPNCADGCPEDMSKTEPGKCGCGISENDSDGDGTPDCKDGCPEYNPLNPDCEPSASEGENKPPVDPNIGDDYQGQTPWGQDPPKTSGSVGGGDHPLPQPPEYKGEKPEDDDQNPDDPEGEEECVGEECHHGTTQSSQPPTQEITPSPPATTSDPPVG